MEERIGDNRKCKVKFNTKCKKPHYYFTHILLLSLLFHLLLISQNIECMYVNEHGNIVNSENSDNNINKIGFSRILDSDYKNYNATFDNVTMSSVSSNFGIRSHRHRRHQHRRQSHDPNVQAIQPKICHSLASSSSYLSSAFAHNFPLSSSSRPSSPSSYNELSIENKLVLSPIVFQGMFLNVFSCTL